MVLKKVALTGASGMVGRHLMHALHTRGIACVATSRRRPAFMPPGNTWFAWDLRDWKSPHELDEQFDSPDAVIHVGALVPEDNVSVVPRDMIDGNVRATLALAEWAAEHEIPLVYLSGAVVYADPLRTGIRENDPKQSGSGIGGFYGASKWIGEQVINAITPENAGCILRPSSIYGAGLPKSKIMQRFLAKARAGETIELEQPADDSMDLIHAADVADAMLNALEHDARGVYNIGSGKLYTMETIAKTAVAVVGSGSVTIARAKADRAPTVRFGLQCEHARKAFGFKAQVGLEEGMRRMYEDSA